MTETLRIIILAVVVLAIVAADVVVIRRGQRGAAYQRKSKVFGKRVEYYAVIATGVLVAGAFVQGDPIAMAILAVPFLIALAFARRAWRAI